MKNGIHTAFQILHALALRSSIQTGLPVVLGISALVLSSAIQAQNQKDKGKNKPADSKALVAAGKTLFVKNCALCHGANGQGTGGPSLQKLTISDAEIGTTIKGGVKGEMPAFGSKFKDADVKALAAFIRSIKK